MRLVLLYQELRCPNCKHKLEEQGTLLSGLHEKTYWCNQCGNIYKKHEEPEKIKKFKEDDCGRQILVE